MIKQLALNDLFFFLYAMYVTIQATAYKIRQTFPYDRDAILNEYQSNTILNDV